MRISPQTALAAAVAALAAAPAAADASPKDLWATVNVCDTAKHPNEMGVRGRMPGDGHHERMYMRFTAQYLNRKKHWQKVDKGASSWMYAGSALFRNRETGFNFKINPKGSEFTLRGMVQFQWRKTREGRTVVVHRTHVYTEGGHKVRESDPKGFSAAKCRIGD
jgi:hypothetical protein